MATINYSAISKFVNELSIKLQREAVLGGRTFDFVTKQGGVKYKDKINIMTSTLQPKLAACGAFSATGSVSLSQREIEAPMITVEEAICITPEQEEYWIGQFTAEGSYNETTAAEFNANYIADKQAKIQRLNEDLYWKGSSTGTYSTSLTQINGLLHQIELTSGSASVVTGTTHSGAPNVGTIEGIVWDMIGNIPADISQEPDLYLFMNTSAYRTLCRALYDANKYEAFAINAAPNTDQGGTWMIKDFAGQGVDIISTPGLNGTHKMVLSTGRNLFVGYDALNDPQNYKTWYSDDNNEWRFQAKWRLGAQYAYPGYIVFKRS